MTQSGPQQTSTVQSKAQQGFTLLETMVSLMILMAALVGILPMYMVSRLQVIRGEINTGAIAVSQRVLSNLRQEINDPSIIGSADDIPDDGLPKNALPSGDSVANISHMGKDYNTTITYCSDSNADDCGISDPMDFPTSSRLIQIQVNFNGDTVYETQTIFTKFERS